MLVFNLTKLATTMVVVAQVIKK